jgi:hypothetical protein
VGSQGGESLHDQRSHCCVLILHSCYLLWLQARGVWCQLRGLDSEEAAQVKVIQHMIAADVGQPPEPSLLHSPGCLLSTGQAVKYTERVWLSLRPLEAGWPRGRSLAMEPNLALLHVTLGRSLHHFCFLLGLYMM